MFHFLKRKQQRVNQWIRLNLPIESTAMGSRKQCWGTSLECKHQYHEKNLGQTLKKNPDAEIMRQKFCTNGPTASRCTNNFGSCRIAGSLHQDPLGAVVQDLSLRTPALYQHSAQSTRTIFADGSSSFETDMHQNPQVQASNAHDLRRK